MPASVMLAQLRIQAKNFRVKDGREGDPGRIGHERVRGGAVDFVSGGDVGDDAAFQRKDVHQRECRATLTEEQLRPLGVGG